MWFEQPCLSLQLVLDKFCMHELLAWAMGHSQCTCRTIQSLSVACALISCAAGMVIAAHRSTSPACKAVPRKDVWFWCHVVLQATGFVLVVIAFAWAQTYLQIPDQAGLGRAHQVLGIVAISLICFQV